jgi:undecaprenyl diphosphate synthase
MRRALPTHIGFIPDGNRRWAVAHGYEKQDGYEFGIAPGVAAIKECIRIGIPEISIYGFTQDNTKRPAAQVAAFRDACVAFARAALSCNVALLVVGDDRSSLFPDDLRQFVTRRGQGMKVNLLINYGWEWDLAGLKTEGAIRSHLVSRMDLVIRWGGGRRLSGFLPVQSVYADIFVVDEYWPDFRPEHLQHATEWFKDQDQTLGG